MSLTDNYAMFGPLTNIPQIQSNLIIDYTRNVKRFPYLRYVDMKPTTSMRGAFRRMKNEQQARVVDLSRFKWPDGEKNPAYDNTTNEDQFEWVYFTLERNAPSTSLGDLTVQMAQQAGLDLLGQTTNHLATQAATARTVDIVNVMTTAGNWNGYTNTCTALAGGVLSAATSTNPYIRILFQTVVQKIVQNTNGAVNIQDIYAVMSPAVAAEINQSSEMIDFLKQQPGVYDIITGADNYNAAYWLPKKLYGVEIVVEDSVEVTTEVNSGSPNRQFIMPSNTIVFLTKQGGIAPAQGNSFGTLALWTYQDFSVEVHHIDADKRSLINVVDNRFIQMVAYESGFLVSAT